MNGLVLAAALAAADPAAGEAVYSRCVGCQALEYNRTGPKHCGVFGRRAGAVPGYAYSDAMRKSGLVWNEKTLERFLAAPTYAGVPEAKERADLIAFLKAQKC